MLRRSHTPAVLLSGAGLAAGLLAVPAAAQLASPTAGRDAAAAPGRHGVSAARVPPGEVAIAVKGERFGLRARITVKGIKGPAKGVKRTVRVKKRTAVKGLPRGRYRVTAKRIAAGGRTSTATVAPKRLRLTRSRGARVVVRYRSVDPQPPTPPASPNPLPTAGPTPSAPPASPPPTTPLTLRPETIAGGLDQTCALDTGASAWCWGSDAKGQVGDGDDDQGNEYSPAKVAGDHAYRTIAAGGYHTCALDSAGKAWCWGYDNIGQTGDGAADQGEKRSPAAVAGDRTYATITAGYDHTCALDTAGKAWCWGYDRSGQVGDGPDGQADEYSPVAVVGSRSYVAIAAGDTHTCALDTAGQAWCWGSDSNGQIGDGNASKSDQYSPVPVTGDRTYTALAAGEAHTCALDRGGKAWCWGYDFSGQVGDGDDGQADNSDPVSVSGDRTYTAIAAGGYHTCALATGGKAWCWGSDNVGEVGDGGGATQGGVYSPAEVAGGRTHATITTGSRHTCAVETGGRAWCWGSDSYGQVGDGDDGQGDQYSPAEVFGGRTWQQP